MSPPEAPSAALVPVAGTETSLTLQGRLPYCNGSPITCLLVQKRLIDAFSKGEWGNSEEFGIPKNVIIVERAGERLDGEDSLARLMEKRSVRTKYSKQKKVSEHEIFLESEVFKVTNTEWMWLCVLCFSYHSFQRDAQKPDGDVFRITVKGLKPAQAYEFRYAVRNAVGVGPCSLSSQRYVSAYIRTHTINSFISVTIYVCAER